MEEGIYKETNNRNESDDIETAYFVPSYHPNGVISQSVAIAPLRNRETSIIMSRLYNSEIYPEHNNYFTHIIFTEAETDMLINALLEVKRRWDSGKVIGK